MSIGTMDLLAFVTAKGLATRRVVANGQPSALTWDPASEAIVGENVLVVLPDLHLGAGGDGDIFSGVATNVTDSRGRLSTFLNALIDAKAAIEPAGTRLRLVQLGDFYDVWRAYPSYRDIPGADYSIIESAYGEVIGKLVNQLDARFCVGNHDATLALYPPWWGRGSNGKANGRLGYAQRLCDNNVLALHGHQAAQIVEVMQAQGGGAWVSFAMWLAGVWNALDEKIQATLDHSFDPDLWPKTLDWANLDTPPKGPFAAAAWAARDGRDVLAKILGGLHEGHMFGADTPRIVFVGHSHRPGISWIEVNEQVVPVVDVGSWTYGRSQFAVAVKGEVSLWEIA
jgi:hypothetical protein